MSDLTIPSCLDIEGVEVRLRTLPGRSDVGSVSWVNERWLNLGCDLHPTEIHMATFEILFVWVGVLDARRIYLWARVGVFHEISRPKQPS